MTSYANGKGRADLARAIGGYGGNGTAARAALGQGEGGVPAPPPAVIALGASVGEGGANRSADVRALKSRLIDLGMTWLARDDRPDADTIAAIRLFQSIVSGRESVRGDGRVDVPGTTYRWLRASNAPRWQRMPAGTRAEGYVNIEAADPRDDHDYGTQWLADTLAAAAAMYRDNYLANRPGAALMTYNDASRPRGGDTPDHSGHECGLSMDARLPRTDGTAPGSTTWEHALYDQDATRAQLQALIAQPLVRRILFNDPQLIGEGLCSEARGHHDHYHVEVHPPAIQDPPAGAQGMEAAGTAERGRIRAGGLGQGGTVAATITLGYGVPEARITDGFYRNAEERNALGRTSGRSRHLGIDVSLSNAASTGATDARRGLPVYAALRRTIPLRELSEARTYGPDDRLGTGVGLPSAGDATLRQATVRVQPWSDDGNAYGGVLGLACLYGYVRNDGSAGTFTLYVEYLHLITDARPPILRDGEAAIAAASWRSTGRGMGFGPQMLEGAVLSADLLAGDRPPLVGYLGATSFPHVHIQLAYSSREVRYSRHPRLNPAIILRTPVTVPQANLEGFILPSTARAQAVALDLPSRSEVVYREDPDRPYGPRWGARRPHGLPESARHTGRTGSARPWIERIADAAGLGRYFVDSVLALGDNESSNTFALPAHIFDARSEAERGERPRITAWGCFQYNAPAWRTLPGVGRDAFPWEADAFDELKKPIDKYAGLWRELDAAGATEVYRNRGMRLFHRTPAGYRRYLAAGRAGGFPAAWNAVEARHREAVDRKLRMAGLLTEPETASSATASPLTGSRVDLHYVVPLIPQPTKTTCWAGSMAMLISYYRQASYPAETLAREMGASLYASYPGWELINGFVDHFRMQRFSLPSNACFLPSPREWYEWLRDFGPLWVTTRGAPSHAVIVHGIHGDLTPEGTTVDIQDPWDIQTRFDADPIEFRPPNAGRSYPRRPFSRLADDFVNMHLDNYGDWRILYIGNRHQYQPQGAAASLALGGPPAPANPDRVGSGILPPRPAERALGRRGVAIPHPSRYFGWTEAPATAAFGQDAGVPASDPWARAVAQFGGTARNAADYPNTVEGFQRYLDDSGVRFFSAQEMTRPHHPDVAREVGFTHFLPRQEWWIRGAALALVADQLRELAGASVSMRNWWRPEAYNRHPTVGGANDSDHVDAYGVDLDFRTADQRRRAEAWITGQQRDQDWLQISLGLGNRTIHVGLLSPGGRRTWQYDSYVR